jgi:hypothetical protein
VLSSRSARRSNSLQDASSDPVAKASPLGKNLLVSCVIARRNVAYWTALISDS